MWTHLQHQNQLENRVGDCDIQEIMTCLSFSSLIKNDNSETQIRGNQSYLFCHSLNISIWVFIGLFATHCFRRKAEASSFCDCFQVKHYIINIIFVVFQVPLILLKQLHFSSSHPFLILKFHSLQLDVIPFSLPDCLTNLPLLLWAPAL